MDQITVQVVQPDIPHYREAFYEKLALDSEINLIVDSSKKLPGTEMPSVSKNAGFKYRVYDCTGYCGDRFYWQHKIDLEPECLKRGVLVICGNPRILSNLYLMYKAKAAGVPVIWWGHGWSSTTKFWRFQIRKQIMKIPNTLVLYTEREKQRFVEMGFDPSRVFGLNNALDQTEIAEQKAKWNADLLEQFREDNSIKNKKVILFCARLMEKNQTDWLLQALSLIVKKDKDYIAAIIGDGPMNGKLKQLADQLELNQNIVWLGAKYLQEEIAPWFLSSVCMAHPAGIGLSILHAFGYGLPVITSGDERYQMPEYSFLENGVDGLFFEHGNTEDLASKILKLGDDPTLQRSFSEKAYEAVCKKYTMDNMVAAFKQAVIATCT